jgi:lipopolysaccharide transport system ATP-binding protein
MSESIVSVENLCKTYWLYPNTIKRILSCFIRPQRISGVLPLKALSGLNFDLYPGEALALIGKNGAGKSTALQLLAGTLQPTSGRYTVKGRLVALLELGSGFNPEFTGRENIVIAGALMGMSKHEIEQETEAIIEFAEIGVYIDQPVKFYSSGMFLRLAFAVALSGKPDILIVDEALSVGDVFFQKKCFERLYKRRQEGMAVILVTHNMQDALEFCERGILLDCGKQVFNGLSKEAIDQYYAKCSNKIVINDESLSSFAEKVNYHEDGCEIDAIFTRFNSEVTSFSLDEQRSQEGVFIRRALLTDTNDQPRRTFYSGSTMRIYSEVIIPVNLMVITFGILLFSSRNVLIHGKNSLQMPDHNLRHIPAGSRVLVKMDIELPLAADTYILNIGVTHIDDKIYKYRYRHHAQGVDSLCERLCQTTKGLSFNVIWDPGHHPLPMTHFGLVELNSVVELQLYHL